LMSTARTALTTTIPERLTVKFKLAPGNWAQLVAMDTEYGAFAEAMTTPGPAGP
jgi:hypothetical protein